jgi:cutinase
MAFSSARRMTLIVVVAGALTAAGLTAVITAASAATCSNVDVVFARGTGETPGLGSVGGPFASAVASDLSGKDVSTYAVNYGANTDQLSAGSGATDMSNHVKTLAASCPDTVFVLGGYSQGASVTDIALGIPTILGFGTAIPTDLAPRVKAVVVFGNPLRLFGTNINDGSQLYGAKALDICNAGDPVCAGGLDFAAHGAYKTNGTIPQGATFAADKVKQG